jgi:allophanate hydrolase subunit 2
MDAFAVLTPGGYTTIQDKGRYGYQQMGIPVSGVLDAFAFQAANLLVGNQGWKSFRVQPGDILDIQQVKSGCRAYLAISGGIDVPEVMGSRATYVGGKIGGYHGRVLKAGDVIKCGQARHSFRVREAPADMIPRYPSDIVIRAIPGPQNDFFREGMDIIFQSDFMVSTKADRMGYRLQGPKVELKKGMPKSIISEPTMPTVISVDLPKVAQATPGDTIRFERVSLETAHLLYQEQLKKMQELEESLARQ